MDFHEIFEGAGRGPSNNRLDFGGNRDHNPHPEFPHVARDPDNRTF